MNVLVFYTEKKTEFSVEVSALEQDIYIGLQIPQEKISNIRIINRYIIEGISEQDFLSVKNTILSESPVDHIYDNLPTLSDANVFAVEYLPGQFNQCADSWSMCITLSTGIETPLVHTSKIYAIYGDLCKDNIDRIKSWIINPVEKRETTINIKQSIKQNYPEPEQVKTLDGFTSLSDTALQELCKSLNLSMDLSDMQFCRAYFGDTEKRDPTVTEIRLLDTYWSDHCRHTTFLTELEVQIDNSEILESYNNYLLLRSSLGLDSKPITLMDIALIGAKALKKKGLLDNLDESEEVNACTLKIEVDVNGKDQDYLLMFKNETHNHPTEIEPFGGAATCLGGAIRDPLSARAFVYQAMRITGAENPLKNVSDTLLGKLSQRKICKTAADGYSSYGNQIGIATGLVHEIYHRGYEAKRMELGAVIGAAPAKNVIRKTPTNGDVVILLGGRTGRDGIGAATSSSKSHTSLSLETCGADVQKGNAPEERKILRFFRDPKVTCLIKRCNDFGAGGVSVSVGEIADGLLINLDKVPVKYNGLDGTEIALSESQERMSVVVSKKNSKKFIKLAARENLEATIIAEVKQEKRMIMNWNGQTIVNLSRELLNSNGAKKFTKAQITNGEINIPGTKNQISSIEQLKQFLGSLNICSQKGLVEYFDSSNGAGTVVAPYGGKYQLTPAQVMAAKIPVLHGDTKTISLMSWGFDPEISSISPYHGAIFSVVYSIAKIIASGGNRKKCYLSFQEYFERLQNDPLRWGKPLAALLGALDAQIGLEVAAIGGKDSMSGSFTLHDGTSIDVPPTLVSFAVSTSKIDKIITPEFKKPDSSVYLLKPPCSPYRKPDFILLQKFFNIAEKLISDKKVLSAWAVGSGGITEAIIKMCLGNRIGFTTENELSADYGFGGFILEVKNGKPEVKIEEITNQEIIIEFLGKTTNEFILKTKLFETPFDTLQNVWEQALEKVYPYNINQNSNTETFTPQKPVLSEQIQTRKNNLCCSWLRNKKPKFVIPVFPGTNGEYDCERAIEKAGGNAEILILRNFSITEITESIKRFNKILSSAHVLVIPGGCSCGDEPNGAAKYIAAFLQKPMVEDSVMNLLLKQDGLICGIGNGFQALVKSGLVPYGKICEMTETSPTITYNTIGRHQSKLVNVKVISNKSPWLSHLEIGSKYILPVSFNEGRFTATEPIIRELADNGQIATQYVDYDGNASQDIRFNPGNSDFSIEGIISPDGRVFGRMAHNERLEEDLFRNIPGIKKMDIFEGAVNFYR